MTTAVFLLPVVFSILILSCEYFHKPPAGSRVLLLYYTLWGGHLNKKEGQKDLYRSFGSIDVVASARSVLQVERDEEDPCIRVVHQVKNSIGPTGGSFKFEIRPESGFKWLGCDPASERKNLSEKNDEPLVFNTKMERAAYLIREMLADKDMKSIDIYEALSEKGIGHRMAEDTKKAIGVRCYRKMKSWYWSLQPKEEEK